MNIKNRLKQIEEANGIGHKFNGDFCKCDSPTIKIFNDENRPSDYPPGHCWNCRKKEVINFKKPFQTVVIIPTVGGGEEIDQ